MGLFKQYIQNEKPKLSDEPVRIRYSPQDMEVAYEFGTWTVDKKGNMYGKMGGYCIEKEALRDSDLICHLFSKGWIEWNDFIPAYFTACKINKIEHVDMRIFYHSALNIGKAK